MNYNITREQAATMPTPWRRSQGHETAIRRNSAAQRITMLTAPTSKTSCTHPRPASMCAPRGGHRYNPRPGPRRHHLTHAAGMGHTSPQRRHQHKARAMYHAHGPQPPHIIRHKPKPPCHVSIYDTKQGGFIFYCDKTRGRTEWMRYETSYHVKASGTGTINVSVRSVSTADSNRNTITSTVFAVGAIFFGFPSCGILSGCTGAVANPAAKLLIKEEHPP